MRKNKLKGINVLKISLKFFFGKNYNLHLRWDIRRQREAYERNKLLKGRSGSGNNLNIQNITENHDTNIGILNIG